MRTTPTFEQARRLHDRDPMTLRRAAIVGAIATVFACSSSEPKAGTEVQATTRAALGSAPLDGTFLFLGAGATPAIPDANVPSYFAELASLGMNTVVIAATRRKVSGGCGPGDYAWVGGMPDRLPFLLEQASARGIQVYVGLDLTTDVCPNFYAEPNASLTASDTALALDAIVARVGNHPAFAGVYIPDEPGLCWPSMFGYYRAIVTQVRARTAKPIVVAPYLAAATQAPQVVAAMARDFLVATGVDIEAWQDSVGADAIDLGWGRGPTVEAYFSAIAGAIGREHLWADTELFSYGILDHFDGAPYSPASIRRLNQQLFAVRPEFTSKRLSWLGQYHMGSVDTARFPEAERLLASYRAIYGLGGEMITPLGYTYATPPAAAYPDSGNELSNVRTGDPKRYTQADWVGIEGNASVTFALPPGKTVDWVGVHVLADVGPGIRFPDSMSLACSQDNVNFQPIGSWPLRVARRASDREYVMSNPTALGASCRFLRLDLANGGWTFVSEVELVQGTVAAVPPVPLPPQPPPPPDAPPPPPQSSLPAIALNVAGAQAPASITRDVRYETTFNLCWSRAGGSADAFCRLYSNVGDSWGIGTGAACFGYDPKPHMMAGNISFTLACSAGPLASSLDVNVNYTR